jgi:RHS repeat-associated protein
MPTLSGFVYDIENRLTQVTHSQNGTDKYRYDPANRRVWHKQPSGTEVTTFYGLDGERMGRYAGTTSWSTWGTSVYFAGKLIWDDAGGVVTDRLGSVVTGNRKYFPYGEEPTTTAQNRVKFATYFRDGTTALDYANQRFYGRTIGRFLTPDQYMPSAYFWDPGTWNRYAYAEDDPANSHDPSGSLASRAGNIRVTSIYGRGSPYKSSPNLRVSSDGSRSMSLGAWNSPSVCVWIPGQGEYSSGSWFCSGSTGSYPGRPKFLKIENDCYVLNYRPGVNMRAVDYRLMDDSYPYPQFYPYMNIEEKLWGDLPQALEGRNTNIGREKGFFRDRHAVNIGSAVDTLSQEFYAVMLDSYGRVTSRIRVYVQGFGESQNWLLGIIKYPQYISIDGDKGGTYGESTGIFTPKEICPFFL